MKAEFEDYNAQNGQFILEKMFYAPDGTQDTNSSLSAEFTLTAQNGRTYTVKVENGKPTTVYLPADTYTMEETGVSDGFAKAADRIVLIEAGSQTRMTDDNAVKNYSTDGLLNLKAYLREYEQGANLEADQSHYTVTITRDGETEPVKQTTLDEAESVYLPRFDGDGRLITYRVKVEGNEQTDRSVLREREERRGRETRSGDSDHLYGRRENPERRLFLHQAAETNHHEAACRCEQPEQRTNVDDHGSSCLRSGRRAAKPRRLS